MKNHRFLWLRNRTTDNRKCEKARNIKEKRTIEMFNTVSRQLVALHSSQRDNNQNTRNPCKHWFTGVSFYPISSIWCLLRIDKKQDDRDETQCPASYFTLCER